MPLTSPLWHAITPMSTRPGPTEITMALISDPTVAGHANLVVRPLSDRLVGLVAAMRAEQAIFEDVVKPILNDFVGTDEVADGAHDDHRVILSKLDLVKFWAQLDAIIVQFDTLASYKDMAKPHVNVIGI